MQGTAGTDREVLLSQILDRASTDASFRGQLLADPKDVIFTEFGVEIPNQYRIRFIERDPELDALVVLPDYSGTNGTGEISDDDLEYVCGGGGGGGDDDEEPTW